MCTIIHKVLNCQSSFILIVLPNGYHLQHCWNFSVFFKIHLLRYNFYNCFHLLTTLAISALVHILYMCIFFHKWHPTFHAFNVVPCSSNSIVDNCTCLKSLLSTSDKVSNSPDKFPHKTRSPMHASKFQIPIKRNDWWSPLQSFWPFAPRCFRDPLVAPHNFSIMF